MWNKNEEGFSLLELMITLLIAGLLVMAFGRLIYTIRYSNRSNEQYFQIINWGQSIMEYTRQQKLEEIIGQHPPEDIIKPGDWDEVFEILNDFDHEVETLIVIDEPFGNTDLYCLKVEIKWKTKMKDRGYKLITYVYQRE